MERRCEQVNQYWWDNLEHFSFRTALVTEAGRRISYQEMLNISDSLSLSAGRRCLVFSLCRNSAESVAGYLGFLRHRIVPVMLAENLAPELLNGLMEAYHPAYIYLPSDRVSPEINGELAWQGEEYTLLRLNFAEDYFLAEDLALLLTTSGSTGSPKLVRQSARNIEANTRSIIEYLGILPEDRAISTLPMNYTYGLSILNSHLAVGASEILTDAGLMEKRFWTLMKEQSPTTFGGVPYTYEMLKKLRFGRMEFPSLRYLTQAGGRLTPELVSEFADICKRKGMRFIVMYGQTEATARMSLLPWEETQPRPGSIGIPIPGGSFSLLDESGNLITEPDQAGELIYRGPNVTMGYAQNRFDLDKPDENNGVLHTGDMAQRDAKGYYYIVGRKKRFLKLFGNRVNLDEVEGLLKQAGFDCACAGTDDRMVVYVAGGAATEGVVSLLREHTAINPKGVAVRSVERIPRNEAGKVMYSLLV